MNLIKDFYNTFTYPFSEPKKNSHINGESIFLYLDAELGGSGFAKKKILDLGCGTGNRSIDIARKFPDASVVGIDISERSIQIANNQKEGLSNIEFICDDFTSCQIDQTYDIVISMGVIHHLQDPQSGVRKIRDFMKEDGLCILWLYHTYGEFDRLLMRDLMSILLGEKFYDRNEAVELLRDIGLHISSNRYGSGYGSMDINENDKLSRDADAFLNPLVKTFTFDEAIDLMSKTEMAWCSVFHIFMTRRSSLSIWTAKIFCHGS